MLFTLLSAISATCAAQGVLFAAECIAGRRAATEAQLTLARIGKRGWAAVVVPAHDEEAGISATLASIATDLAPQDRIIVVADNCSDDTAGVANHDGARVLVRDCPELRGKGYAIRFAVEALKDTPPDVVVILDADCRVRPGSLRALVDSALATGGPVQADYVLRAPRGGAFRAAARISEFAVIVRNRVRPRGGKRFGVPSPLTGSGMAFPWKVLEAAPSMEGNIVEDLALGVELSLRGKPTTYVPRARIESELPTADSASDTQRSRWETGHLATLISKVPQLLKGGIAQRRADLLLQALDLSIPPLSLLVLVQGGLVVVTAAAWGTGGSVLPLALATTGFTSLAIGVFVAWKWEGQDVVPARHLGAIPLYALRKVPRYLRFVVRGPEKKWVRTAREDAA